MNIEIGQLVEWCMAYHMAIIIGFSGSYAVIYSATDGTTFLVSIIAKDETYVIVFYMKYSCTHMVAIDLYGNLYGRRFKEGIWKYVE